MAVQDLLKRYQGGRRPPLDELINGELLKIFQRGVVGEKVRPLGILLPDLDRPAGSREQWSAGRWMDLMEDWETHCVRLRCWKDKEGYPVFDVRCKECDITHACMADQQRKPVIYLCDGGMVDYALPVVIDGQTVAVLLTGQQRPCGGNKWSKTFVAGFAAENGVAGSVDAWEESVTRNTGMMDEMRTLGGDTPPDLVTLAEHACVVSPEAVQETLREMESATRHLASLAEQTTRYEFDTIRGFFTSQVAKLLSVPDEDFGPKFSEFLGDLAQFYGFDYGFLYMLKRESDEYMHLFTKIDGKFLEGKPPLIPSSPFFDHSDSSNCRPVRYKPADAKQKIFKSKYLFDSPCYVVPMVVNGPLGIVVFGCTGRKKTNSLSDATASLLQRQFEDVCIILENRRQMQMRDMYVTDIAHEVRSPLAAVLATAENLERGAVDQMQYRAFRIIVRLQRLQMAIERFMMLDKLLTSAEPLKSIFLSIYEKAVHCAGLYTEIAEEQGVKLTVNKDALYGLPRVLANEEAFNHALGNLIQNAIKYGDPGTEVVIEGRVVGNHVKVDVEDIGIPLLSEAIPLLGQRHFRTKQAIQRDPTGTGIGLTLVTRFLKIVGGELKIESQEVQHGRHHVIFSMYLPR
jgi:hypothetical protein